MRWWASFVAVLVAFVFVSLLAVTAALGQSVPCAPHDFIVQRLADRYGETLQSVGVAGDSVTIVEVYTNDGEQTFTIVVRRQDGIACVIAAGTSWVSVARAEPKRGEEM